ncbi:MAG: S-methyl-5'-thioadenosine phosphorylase [Myxococcaceae bacterium]
MAFKRLGIIGGSGLGEALSGVARGTSHELDTPFGQPSGPILTADLDGIPVALLSRHGPGHLRSPTQVNYRANLYALKSLGVTHILASTAVGSLREEIHPGELAIPDQLIDRTFRRATTFFDELAVHVEMGAPVCGTLRSALLKSAEDFGTRVHPSATYVCMEGPQLSTRAESEYHRSLGAHLIGMTAMPEAKLAREAELCYALVSLPTDYDCWRPAPRDVPAMELLKEIAANLARGSEQALALIRKAAPRVAQLGEAPCSCQSALEHGIWSDHGAIPEVLKQKYRLLLARRLGL